VRRFGDRVDHWRQGFEQELAEVQMATEEQARADVATDRTLKQTQQEILATERDIARLRDRVRLVDEFRSVGDLVGARLRSGTYDERLGVMQTISDDLTSLTESLTVGTDDIHGTEKKKVFPRGPARVVLFIDDLDRCPPPKVVEVLEAVQLLLSTDLFVVVIALDVRYVTKALEAHYEGVLSADGEPSGIDYLEKIVQIPYRTRSLRPETAQQFIAGNLRITSLPDGGPPPGNGASPVDGNGSGSGSGNGSTAPDGSAGAGGAELTARELLFTPAEVAVIAGLCSALELSPRSAKRVANVAKLYRMVSARRGLPNPGPEQTAAVALLVAAAAAHPEVQRLALDTLARLSVAGGLDQDVGPWAEVVALPADTDAARARLADWRAAIAAVKDVPVVMSDTVTRTVGSLSLRELTDVVGFVSSFSFVSD
jgi:hypothetical protein